MNNNNAKKIGNIGQWIMVLGAVMYVAELVVMENNAMTYAILGVFLVSIVMQLIGWAGTKDERKAQKAAEKAAKQAKTK